MTKLFVIQWITVNPPVAVPNFLTKFWQLELFFNQTWRILSHNMILFFCFYSSSGVNPEWHWLLFEHLLSIKVILIVRWTDWWSSFTSSWSCKVYSFQIRISWPSHLVTPWTTWAFRQSIYLWYSWAWCVHSSCFGGKTISVVRVKKNVWCFYCQDWVC